MPAGRRLLEGLVDRVLDRVRAQFRSGRAKGLFVQVDQVLRHQLSIYVADAVYIGNQNPTNGAGKESMKTGLGRGPNVCVRPGTQHVARGVCRLDIGGCARYLVIGA